MKRKIKPKHKILKYTALIIGALLLLSAAGLYQYNYYTVEKNRKLLISLSEDMKALQVEFNKVQDGWSYDEYCRGMGSTLDRNNQIACMVELNNPNDNNSLDNHDKYINIIEGSKEFETKRLHEVGGFDKEFTISKFLPIGIPRSSCSLSSSNSQEDDYQGSSFYCVSTDVGGFYFRNRY